MELKRITTDKAPNPGGWYSQAFVVGDFVFTAGVTANDPVTQEMVGPGDIVLQTRQAIKNLEQILIAAGTDLKHVVKTLVFVSNIDDFAVFNEEYKKFFPVDPPARSTMQIGKFNNGMVIEIEAVAVLPN
ncbi:MULTISPECIES: RidA family protein [Anaerotruncus]|jgi:2-iminobutanoate/2-iminopropanoate deaminase|uniref:RidA family protein n=1 Tax=Anaerotruncus TaxID=244127 RepID=UPI00083096B3|nr:MULTISPECIES: RidA family protein [Anaerotruncus]MDD3165389.1 RidA family protein [Oscillospiraceae bacterium]RGX54625.1 RidA family protein [Anaerotruncus sp. AF02-27]